MKPPKTTIPYGFCHCGCGKKAPLPPYSHTKRGWQAGKPLKFVHGHNRKTLRRPSHLSKDRSHAIAYAKCGTAFQINKSDRAFVDAHNWVYANGYIRMSHNGNIRSLHIALLGPPPKGYRWDHEDRNTLNNRRSNLRLGTHAQNMMNRKLNANSTSGFKGVYAAISGHKNYTGKWTAEIRVDKKTIGLGRTFLSRQDAARAYDAAAIKYFGPFACTNEMLGLL